MFCSKCGKEILDEAVVCIHCGCAVNNKITKNSNKTFLSTLLLCIFLGEFGAHRFYTGHIGSAIIQLIMSLTIILLPITLIWVFIDFIFILVGSFKTASGEELAK